MARATAKAAELEVDEKQATAMVENGVLQLTLPKR